jgi:hypothetical protein
MQQGRGYESNPGIKISAIGHQTFGLMCYYINHKANGIDCTVTFPSECIRSTHWRVSSSRSWEEIVTLSCDIPQ